MATVPSRPAPKMRCFASVFLVTTFIIGAIAGPWPQQSETQCASVCTENKKFQYDVGTSYWYRYEGDVRSGVDMTKDNTQLRIRATVEIQPLSKCDFIMRLSEVTMGKDQSETSRDARFANALEGHPLRFAFQDGRIGDLCPDAREPVWVLNIKRGVLSAFQNTMDNFDKDQSQNEVDITGKCVTDYQVTRGERPGIVIRKTKDLVNCSSRLDRYSAIQASQSPAGFGSLTSTPLIKSSHTCRQYVEHGILRETVCTEEHQFQPFSRKDSGATTESVQRLTFVSEKRVDDVPTDSKDYVVVRKSMLFNHDGHGQEENDVQKSEANDALKELCRVAGDEVTPEVPNIFTRVVRNLQKLDREQLRDVYDNVGTICEGSSKAKKFMLDALLMVGSDAGVNVMKDLILQNEVPDKEAHNWFLMLGFMAKPTRSMIASLTDLLRPTISERYPKAFLGISALVNSYCKKNADCGSQVEVQDFVVRLRLASNVAPDCQTSTDEERQKAIVTLKALGNVGHFDNVVNFVQQCYRSTSNAVDVRLAAIDAFRRQSCTNDRTDLLRQFFDQQEDSEVRIASYLASMVCPTSDVLAQVHKSLYTEEVNQVGSFVWTHLKNLQERPNYEHKYDVQKIVSSKKLQEKFSTDFRKFSRYYEMSAYVDSLRTGFRADGAVVFSRKSYLPRSADLGLQLELFGETLDLLTIGGRAEGFEPLVESLFGQNGYFHDETIQKMLESVRQQNPYSEQKMNSISRIFNMKNVNDPDPMGAFYMRIFGNDLHYSQFRGLDGMLSNLEGLSIMETLVKLSQEQTTTYTKNVLFMDSSIVVPTSIGFPLNLTITGAASVNVKVGGKIDLSRVSSGSFDAAVHLQPSAAVEISGTMMVEGFYRRSGLKIATTMHTSTDSNFEISAENGQVVHARIMVPKNQQDIFDIQSKVIIEDDEAERVHMPLVNETMDIERCSNGVITTYLGVELCGQLQFPVRTAHSESQDPAWILAGPYVTRLFLRKTDPTIKTYEFEYRWSKETIQLDTGLAVRTGRLSFDTPGSSIDRKLMAEFVHNDAEKSVSLSLVAPSKKILAHGKIVNESNRKSLSMNLIVNDVEIVSLNTDLSLQTNDVAGLQLTPSLLMSLYGRPVLALKGHFVKLDGKKYGAEVTVEHLTTYPITVSGAVSSVGSNDNQNYVVDVSMDTGYLKSATKVWLQKGDSNMVLKGTTSYNLRNGQSNSATLSAKYDSTVDTKGSRTWQANADFRSPAYPHYNWGLNATAQLGSIGYRQVETALTFAYGIDDTARDVQKLTVQYKHDFDLETEVHRSTSVAKVTFPPANIDAALEFHNQISSNAIDAELTAKYRKDKKWNLVMTGSRGGENGVLVRGMSRLMTADGNGIKLDGDLRLTPEMEYTAKLTGDWMNNGGGGQNATAILRLKPRPNALGPFDRQLTAELLLPGQAPLTLTADVLYNALHKSFQAEAEMDKQKYRTYAEYHRPSLDNVQIALGAHSPDKSYTASAQLDNGQTEKTFETELQLQDSPKMAASMRFKRDDQATKMSALVSRGPDAYSVGLDYRTVGSEGQIVASSPNRDLGFSWNETVIVAVGQPANQMMRSTYELWWQPDKRIVADVTLSGHFKLDERRLKADVHIKTPFHGIEELGLRFAHKDDFGSWNTAVVALLSGETVGAVSSEGRVNFATESTEVRANVRVEMPFPTMPTFGFDLVHNCTRQEFLSDINISWYPEQQMDVKVHGQMPGDMLTAAVEIKTPFEALRDASVSGEFARRDKLTGHLRLARDNDAIAVSIEGDVQFGADKIESYLKMDATTPWNVTPSMMLSLSLNESSVATGATFSWTPDKTIVVQLAASRDADDEAVSVTAQLTTPFDAVRDVRLTARHGHRNGRRSGGEGVHLRSGIDLSYNGQDFDVQLDYAKPSWRQTDMSLVIGEPYGVFKRLTVRGHLHFPEDKVDFGVRTTWHDDQVVALASKFERNDSSLDGSVIVRLPFESCRKIQVVFGNVRDPSRRKCHSHFAVDIDGQRVMAEHTTTFRDLGNFDNEMYMRLPLPYLRDVKLTTTQQTSDDKLRHKTDLIFDSDADGRYSLEATADVSRGGDPQATLTIRSPHWYAIVTASHDISDSLMKLQVELPRQHKYILTAKHDLKRTGNAGGSVILELTTPIEGWQHLSASVNFADLTGSALMQWQPDRAVQVTWKLQDIRDLEVSVQTPFDGYETTSIRAQLDVDKSKLAALVQATFLNDKYQVAVHGHRERYFAEVELLLETSLSAVDKFTIGGKYDGRQPGVQSASLKVGTFEVAAVRKFADGYEYVSIVVTTPIGGYEYVKTEAKFDASINKVTFDFRRPGVVLEATIGVPVEPASAYLKVALTSPSVKKVSVEGEIRFGSNGDDDDARSLDVALMHDDQKAQLSFTMTGSQQKRKVSVQVQWPSSNLTAYGQYDVTASPVTAQLVMSDGHNNQATVDINVNIQSDSVDFQLAATSSMSSLRDIKIAGGFRSSPEALITHMSIDKDGKRSCELQLATSLSGRNRGHYQLALKTPFAGYEQSEFAVDVDLESAYHRSLSVFGRREDQSFAIDAEVQYDENGRRLRRMSVDVNSTVPSYEHMSVSLDIDSQSESKAETTTTATTYLATFIRRPDVTYQLKLDTESVPSSHVASNLLLRTSVQEVLRLYGRYGLNGIGTQTMDIKASAGSRMIEFSWELWRKESWRKLQSNVTFNTNCFGTMIASAIGVNYDMFSSDAGRADFALQSDVNGIRNTISGKLALANGKDELVDVNVEGDIQSVPAIGKFSSRGTIDSVGDSGLKLAVKFNDKHSAQVTGTYVRTSSKIEGTLALATSVAGYESMSVTATLASKPPNTKLSVSLQSNGKSLVHLAATLTPSTDLDVAFTSALSNWQSTGKLRLTIERDGQKATLAAKLNDQSVIGNYDLQIDGQSGTLLVSWSMDASSGQTDVKIDFDQATLETRFSLKSHDVTTVTAHFRPPNDHNVTGLLTAETVHAGRTLFTLDYVFGHLLNRLSVAVGSEQLELNCDLATDRKHFLADYSRDGKSRCSVEASLDLAHASRREVQFNLRTPVDGLQDVRYETVFDADESQLTAMLQWRRDEAIQFRFGLDPDRSRVVATMTTPFAGFETMDFTAYKSSDDSSNSRSASLRFQWQDKKMELTARCEPTIKELSLSSPFEGFTQMTARLTYDTGVSNTAASLRLSINEKVLDFVTDIKVTADGAHLEAKTIVGGRELYAIGAHYDAATGYASLLLKCRDRQIDVDVALKSVDNGGRLLTATLTTTFDSLSKLGLTMSHARDGANRTALVRLDVGDRSFETSGHLALDERSLGAGLRVGSASTTTDKYQRQVVVNKEEAQLTVLIERPDGTLNGVVRLSSTSGLRFVPNLSAHVAHDFRRPSAKLMVHWNDLNTIKCNFEVTDDSDLAFEFDSQIHPLGHSHAHVHVHVHPDPRRSTLDAKLDVEGFFKAALEIDINSTAVPQSFDAVGRLTTSISGFRETSAAISFVNNDDNGGSMRTNAILRTPFDVLRTTQLIVSTENEDDQTRAAKVKLSFDEVESTVKVSWNRKNRSGIRGTLLVESPFIGYLVATNGPNFKPRFQTTVAIRPGYYLMETTLTAGDKDTTATLLGKYVRGQSDGHREVRLEVAAAKIKYQLHWQHDNNGGQLNVTVPDYGHAVHQTLSVDYSLKTQPTERQPFYSLSLRSNLSGRRKCTSSLAVTMHRHFWKFNADLQVTSGQDGHRHHLAAGYDLGDDSVKSHLTIDCKFLPSKTIQMDAKMDVENLNVMVNVGSVRNVLKATYIKDKTSTGTFDVQATLDLPSLWIESTKLKGQLTFAEDQETIQGQMTVQHQQHSALGSFQHGNGASHVDLKADNLFISGRLSPNDGKARLLMKGIGGPHSRAIDTDWDLDKTRAKLDYLVDNTRVFGLEGSLVVKQDLDIVDGHFSVYHGGVNHSIQVGWTKSRIGDSDADYRFLMRTPLMGIDTLGLRSRLARNYGKHFEGSLAMDLPQSSHSISAKFDRDPRNVQFEAMADSPYMASRAYTLIGKASREGGRRFVTFTLANPSESHTVRIETTRDDKGTAVIQATLDTPFLDIGQMIFTMSVDKLTPREIDVTYQLTTDERTSHVLKTRFIKGNNSFSVHLECDTPLLTPSHSELDVSLDVASVTRMTFDVKATIVGKPLLITGVVHRQAPDLKVKGRFKTGFEDNAFEIHVRREAGAFSGSMQVEGDRVPGQKFQISGFYRLNVADSMEGGLAVASADRRLKFETNYRPRSKRSVAGLLEYRPAAANDNVAPDLGLYLEYGGPRTATFRVRTPIEDYEDLKVSYNVEREADGTAVLNVTLDNGRVVYGLDSQILYRPPDIAKAHIAFTWSHQRYSVGGEIRKGPDTFEAGFHVDLPIQGLRNIDYKIEMIEGLADESFLSVLSGMPLQHDIRYDIQHGKASKGCRGQVTLDLPIAGLRDVSIVYSTTQKNGQWQFTLEHKTSGQLIVQVDAIAVNRPGIGNGKIQVMAPSYGLQNSNVYYSYEESYAKGSGVKATWGLNHNGKNLIELKMKSNDGTTTLEILRSTRPVTIEYTLKKDAVTGTTNIAGTYCWNGDSPQDSTVGFNARIRQQRGGLQASIATVHPTRPVRIELSLAATNYQVKQDVEFSWGGQNEAISYSLEINKKLVKVELGFPTRKVRMVLQPYRKTGGMYTTSMSLEWDADVDETKRIGYHVKWQIPNKTGSRLERYYEFGLSHPRLEKDLTVSGRFVVDLADTRLAMARLELDFSKDEKQKLVAEMSLDKTNDMPTGMGYVLKSGIHHLASGLNIATVTIVRNDDDVASGWLYMSHLDNERQMKSLQLGFQFLKTLNKLQAQIEAPETKFHFVGHLSRNEQNGYTVHMESSLNDQETPYSAELQLDRKDRHMAALKVLYNPDMKSTMMMRSGMPNKKTISLEILHTDNGKTIEDVKFDLNLNESRELVTRFHWRPQSLQEIQDSLPQLMQGICSKTKEVTASVNDYIANDFAIKYDRFFESFSRSVNPMITDLGKEIDVIGADLRLANGAFTKLYEDNVFYFRNICDIIAPLRIGERLKDLINGALQVVVNITYGIMYVMQNTVEATGSLCRMACEDFVPAFARHIRDVPYVVMHHANTLHELSLWTVHQLTMQTVRIIGDMLVYIAEAVHQWNGVTPEWIHQVPAETTAKLQAYLDKFFASEYYMKLKYLIDDITQSIQKACDQEFCGRAYNLMRNQFLNLADGLSSGRVADTIKTVYKTVTWAYDFLDIEGLARQLLQTIMVRLEHVALNTFEKIILPDMSRDVVFQPEDGKLEIRQRLPLPWTSFDESPYVDDLHFDKLRENFGHLPSAAFENFKREFIGPSSSEGDFKFRARALLVGDQHYVTFDGHAYEFAGQCSYVLAKDFVDGKFTAIVNYDQSRATKKSLLIEVDGHQVEIVSRTTRVLIDGQPTVTPAQFASTHVSRTGDTIMVASDVRQVWLTYDATNDFAVLDIGGFYHGKTGGLFGNYDHEPYNDHQAPDRSASVDFAKHWEVGRDACPSHENQARTVDIGYEARMPCDELFGQFASLRSCFKSIKPSAYKNMCLNDVSIGKGSCSSAAAYVAMCRFQGIHVTIPKSCLECDVNGATLAQDEETVVEGSAIERTADVVFVVDNTWQCSTTFANMRTTLATVARNIEGALQTARVQYNRYGVVGYGGAEGRPQAFTVDGQTFVGAVSDLDPALKNIHFSNGRHHHLSDLIEYAVTEMHDYRHTSKKIFVVVPCATETDESDEIVDRIRKRLVDTDANVHVISIREPVARDNNKIDVTNIIGYDSRTAYTLKSALRGQLIGDDKTRRLMTIDETAVVKLAFATNGSVFYASRLGSVQPSVSRLANEGFARRIASKAVPATCQNCQCTVTASSGKPVTVCSKCSNDAVQEVTFGSETLQNRGNQAGKKVPLRKLSRKKALDEKTRYNKF